MQTSELDWRRTSVAGNKFLLSTFLYSSLDNKQLRVGKRTMSNSLPQYSNYPTFMYIKKSFRPMDFHMFELLPSEEKHCFYYQYH